MIPKIADAALVTLAAQQGRPQSWFVGADAVAEGERKASELQCATKSNHKLSKSLAIEEFARIGISVQNQFSANEKTMLKREQIALWNVTSSRGG
jgi:hypothetical protein